MRGISKWSNTLLFARINLKFARIINLIVSSNKFNYNYSESPVINTIDTSNDPDVVQNSKLHFIGKIRIFLDNPTDTKSWKQTMRTDCQRLIQIPWLTNSFNQIAFGILSNCCSIISQLIATDDFNLDKQLKIVSFTISSLQSIANFSKVHVSSMKNHQHEEENAVALRSRKDLSYCDDLSSTRHVLYTNHISWTCNNNSITTFQINAQHLKQSVQTHTFT